MEIKVKCNCGADKCVEWAILELQGVVESQPSVANQIQGLEIGRLCCSSSSSSQVLFLFSLSLKFQTFLVFSATHQNATLQK
jgi:hypothetical protein